MTEPTPVKLPGLDIVFPSITACARHFGLKRTTVQGALDRGSLEAIGTGNNTLKMKPVWVRRQDGGWDHFKSHADYGRAYGRTPETVSKFMRRMYDTPNETKHHPLTGCYVRVTAPEEEQV